MRYYFIGIQKTIEDKYAFENQGFDDNLDNAKITFYKKLASYIGEPKIKACLAEVIDEVGNVVAKEYWRDESAENTDVDTSEKTENDTTVTEPTR